MDGELVKAVTEQVVQMLRQRGVTVTPAASRPPMAAQAGRTAPTPVAATRKVFITAEVLAGRLAAGGGQVDLAWNEVLTPGAIDVVEQKRLAIRRLSAPAALGPGVAGSPATAGGASAVEGPAAPCACGAIGIITHGADDKVRGVLSSLGREGVATRDFTEGDCWMTNLRRLCQAVAAGEVAAGAAILPYAADAMVLAGKIKGIRPVQGTRPESVAAGLRHFGANLLVLEHAFSTHHQLRTMLLALAGGGRGAGRALEAALTELERP